MAEFHDGNVTEIHKKVATGGYVLRVGVLEDFDATKTKKQTGVRKNWQEILKKSREKSAKSTDSQEQLTGKDWSSFTVGKFY